MVERGLENKLMGPETNSPQKVGSKVKNPGVTPYFSEINLKNSKTHMLHSKRQTRRIARWYIDSIQTALRNVGLIVNQNLKNIMKKGKSRRIQYLYPGEML